MGKGRVIGYCIGGALVLILSFAVTLWLTEPDVPPAEKIRLLQASAISDETALSRAAQAAGLQFSPYVRGHVDTLNRVDDKTVNITGWATETITTISKGAPVLIMVFSAGQNLLTMQAQGERSDVTAALKLSPEAARNVAFSGTLSCKPPAKLFVVVGSLGGTYASLGSHNCP